jgi:RNA polymerase sigma-70 factor (ECF subfamily)
MGLSFAQMSEAKIDTVPPPPVEMDDRALVAAARRDPRAFGALYEKYVTPIYRYAYVRLRNEPAAQDATSQTFLKALQALPQFRDGLFIAWLYRIAHNVCADAIRRAPFTENYDALEFQLHADDSPEENALREIERAAFYRALNELPQEQRDVLEMTLGGWKGEEIARILGKTHAAVKMLRWRGMQSIKARVAEQGLLESESGFLGEVQE